jgi:hypothetical protein
MASRLAKGVGILQVGVCTAVNHGFAWQTSRGSGLAAAFVLHENVKRASQHDKIMGWKGLESKLAAHGS